MTTESDLTAVLARAIATPDATWVSQPNRLRLILQQELGPEARAHRGQIHQLVVAAQERVPTRLQRDGCSAEARQDLVDLLVGTRGWTEQAAEWTVATWAAALGLSGETESPVPVDPAGPPLDEAASSASEVPATGHLRPAPTALGYAADLRDATEPPDTTDPAPSLSVSDPVVPPSFISHATDLPTATDLPEAATPLTRTSGGDAAEPAPDRLPAPPPPPPADEPTPLPTRQTKAITAKASHLIGQPVDVAYLVKAANPAIVLAAFPFLIAALTIKGIAGSLALILFPLAVAVLHLVPPACVLAVRGADVVLLSASRLGKPTGVLATVSRAEIHPGGGWPFPSVNIGERRVWFLLPHRAAAKALPIRPGVDA